MYICQICKKVPATIHLTDIHNNVKKEVHICESCAAEKGFNLQGAANLPQLLGLAAKKSTPGPHKAAALKAQVIEKDVVCEHCGMAWSQFGERGRLGCPHDYQSFDAKLRPLIANQIAAERRDGDKFHVGKQPGASAMKDDREKMIRQLLKKMHAAVAEENYEAAAMLKGEIEGLRVDESDAKDAPGQK